MNKQELAFFNTLLNDRLKQLVAQADDTRSGLQVFNTYPVDPIDQAVFEFDRNFTLRIRDREMKLFNKILEALDRIEEGSFGICEECGEDIAFERLKARPVASYCIDCKTQKEKQEKSPGYYNPDQHKYERITQ